MASEINADPLFTATANGSTVMIGGSFNTEFGVDMFLSDTTTNLSGTAGVQSVPEPPTLTLLGIGAVCSLGYGWKRRKQAVT